MPLKLSDLQTHEEVLAEDLQDPEFRAEWERTAPARAVGIALSSYRVQHGISQRELATLLGVSQPVVARWEVGEHNPTFETLRLIAEKLGIEFAFAISPPGARTPWLSTKPTGAGRFERETLPNGVGFASASREINPSMTRSPASRTAAKGGKKGEKIATR